MRRSLIDDNKNAGLFSLSAELVVEATLIRDTRAQASDLLWGNGISAVRFFDSPRRASLTLRDSIVAGNREAGIYVESSDAVLERSIVRDTMAQEADGAFGFGIETREYAGVRPSLGCSHCLVERNRLAGIALDGTDAIIDATRVADTAPSSDDAGGAGLSARASSDGRELTELDLSNSSFEGNTFAGVVVWGAHARIESIRISDTVGARGGSGAGLLVSLTPTGLEATAAVRSSLVERNSLTAVAVSGAASLEGVLVRGESPEGQREHCVEVVGYPNTSSRASLDVSGSLIEQCKGVALLTARSDATVDATVVRDLWSENDGRFGRGMSFQEQTDALISRSLVSDTRELGIAAIDSTVGVSHSTVTRTAVDGNGSLGDGLSALASTLSLSECRVEGSARAAVSSFGGQVSIADTTLECNGIALDGEPWDAEPAHFTDGGGNVCGCAGHLVDCIVLGAGLTPPAPVQGQAPPP